MCAHLAWLVFAHEHEVKILFIIGQINGGWFTNRHSIAGLSLQKISNFERIRVVARCVEIVFKLWRLRNAWVGYWRRRGFRCWRICLRRCGLRLCDAAQRAQGYDDSALAYPLY